MSMLTTKTSEGMFSSIPPRVLSLIVVLSINSLGFSYLMVVLAAYLPELGVSAADVGLIMGVDGLALILSGIPLGILSDRRGRKWILILGGFGAAPIFIIFAFTTETYYLLLAGIIGGITEGTFLSTVNAIIADQTTQQNRNTAFSLSFILATATSGIGSAIPFAFPFLQPFLGLDIHTLHRDFFILFGIVGALSPIALWIILRNYVEKKHEYRKQSGERHLGLILKFSASNSIIGLGAGFIIPLVPTWLFFRFGIQDTYSGPLLAISNVMMGLAAILSPRLAKKYGAIKTIVVNEAIATFFMFLLAFVGNPLAAGVLYILRASLMNMASPLADSFLMSIVSEDERGLASAINSVIWRLPNSITTILGGIILGAGDFTLPFFLASGFYTIGIGTFYVLFRKTSLRS